MDALSLRSASPTSANIPSCHKRQLTCVSLYCFDLTLNRYRYDDASYNSRPIYNSAGISARIKLSPVEFSVRLADDFRSGYQTSEMNGHKLMSNASIDYSFCKNKCCLSLWVDDIFNKDIYYKSEYSAYQREEYSANYLHHYMNLTFTYRFDAKGKK